MITIYGPHSPRRIDRREQLGDYIPFDEPGFCIVAPTLDNALRQYESEFSVNIELYDGSLNGVDLGSPPRYFFYYVNGVPVIVDIHIERKSKAVYPKQNLGFELCDEDIILIGELIG